MSSNDAVVGSERGTEPQSMACRSGQRRELDDRS